jgi:hypothetical protein
MLKSLKPFANALRADALRGNQNWIKTMKASADSPDS